VAGVSLPAAAPNALQVTDFTTLDGLTAAPWPDAEGAAPTSTIAVAGAPADAVRPSALRLDYDFPSDRCTQVRLDMALPPCGNYARLTFALQGDDSGNVLEVWTGEQARGWHGAGSVTLDFSDWRDVSLGLDDNYTVLAHTLRFVVRRAGTLGAHTVWLDDIGLEGPTEKPLPEDFAVGPRVPGPPPFEYPKEFLIEKRRVGEKTVALLDGEPLACVLDALPTPGYLELARRAGVNCFALDLYWRDLEPEPGFGRWQPLRQFVDWVGQAGFGVILLVNPHQPRWLTAGHGAEPLHGGMMYPGAPAAREGFERFLNRFLPQFATARNVVVIGVGAGGEADANFPEPPGDVCAWRQSPSLLRDYRAFLKGKHGVAADPNAVPPMPLGDARGPWVDLRPSWHDWREFVDRFWADQTEWQGALVHRLLPGRLTMVRFGWPVFQCENVFLIRECQHIDMVQCKDAVPTWEQATPWFLVSRAALYHGAIRGTDKVSFPEFDVGHNRGRPTSADMTTFLPPLAPFCGGLWYYRGLDEAFAEGLGEAFETLRTETLRPTQPAIAVFYGQQYANWTQYHANYANEAALAGAARVLGEAGLPFTVISEYTLADLKDMRTLILADNPILPEKAAQAIEDFAARGGRLAIEDLERQGLDGAAVTLRLPNSALHLPAGFCASVQPRDEGLQLSARQRATLQGLVAWLRAE
jgi:hypothetical protein